MNIYLTINEIVENRALNMPVGEWFSVAQINNTEHDSRCWLHLTSMVRAQYSRVTDNAMLHHHQEDLYLFCWQRQKES